MERGLVIILLADKVRSEQRSTEGTTKYLKDAYHLSWYLLSSHKAKHTSAAMRYLDKTPLHVEQVHSAFSGPDTDTRWSNKGDTFGVKVLLGSLFANKVRTSDLDPVRKEDRKWNIWSLVAYWFSDTFNAATWEFASSMLAVGLSYRDALGIVAVAFFTVSIVISLNGAVGVLYHAPFPVLARASWGFWGSYGW